MDVMEKLTVMKALLMTIKRISLQAVYPLIRSRSQRSGLKYASEKTVLANGGVFENCIEVNGCMMKRCWITV